MKKTLPIAIATVTLILMSGRTLAAEGTSNTSLVDTPRMAEPSELSPHIGIYAGSGSQNGSLYNMGAAFQIDAGFQPIVPISFSLQAGYEPSSIDVPGNNIDFNTTNILLKEVLNFGGTIPVVKHSYVGTKTGVAIYSGDLDSKTHFAVGGVVGFDIPLTNAQRVSLGAEGTYLGVLGDDVLTPDQTTVLGAMKYWF